MSNKRIFDFIISLIGIIVLLPVFMVIAALIKSTSRGPVLFRQLRVGRLGHVFYIHKFRTMIIDAEDLGPKITIDADKRITWVGAFLRRYKLDELPQLYDVLLGKMSIVGPRPEVPEFVNIYPAEIKKIVLSVRPGITELASIIMIDESKLLRGVDDPKWVYREKILPQKLGYAVKYVKTRTFWGDMVIILRTIQKIFVR